MENILDNILNFLNKYFNSIPFTTEELIAEIATKPLDPISFNKLDLTNIRSYLDYLTHEHYITLYNEDPLQYKLNSLGKVFIQTGGFTIQKEIKENFRRSTLDTNTSVRLTNKLTQQNILTQKRIGYLTLFVSSVAVVFSVISLFKYTETSTKQINTTLEKHLQTLDSIQQYLKVYLHDQKSNLPDSSKTHP